MIKTGTKRKWK